MADTPFFAALTDLLKPILRWRGLPALLLPAILVAVAGPASAQWVPAPVAHGLAITPGQLPVPLPPPVPGCGVFAGSAWRSVPCATDEELRREHLPLPTTPNAIQSTPHPFAFINGHPIDATTPIILGSVGMAFISDPRKVTENDLGAANEFSIQTNTNYFVCSTCRAGYPFGAIAGIPNSASAAGDPAWVQFAYQNFGGNSTSLFIFQIDLAININTNGAYFGSNVNGGFANANEAGFHKNCVASLPVTGTLTGPQAVVPQAGQSPAVGSSWVIGYSTCPSSGCVLQIVAFLPWANENWYTITVKDALGLHGNWTDVNGSILGVGGNTQAVFSSGTKIQQALTAYSCVEAFSAATGWEPQACPAPFPPTAFGTELTATPTFSPNTGETNNLVAGRVTFTCATFDCVLNFNSTAQ